MTKENFQKIPYDSKSSALLVIDMQEGFRASMKNNNVIGNIKNLVGTSHNRMIPVIWTQHGHRNFDLNAPLVAWWGIENTVKYDSDEWQIVKELQPYIQRDPDSLDKLDFKIVSKARYDAFYKTELNSLLRSLNVNTVIICGVMTNLCCETTARGAFNKDYNVVFLDDACGTTSEEMHKATLLNLEFGFAKIANVKDVVNWL